MDKSISRAIIDICQKLNINYTSPYQKDILYNDAKRLGEIVMEIESSIDELSCILCRHKVGDYTVEKIEKDLRELHEIDHDLINLSQKIKSEIK